MIDLGIAHAHAVPYPNDMKHGSREAGFTLPELLVAGGILLVATIVAAFIVQPKDFGPVSRNAERWIGIAQFAQGIKQYASANGTVPKGITTKTQVIGTAEGSLDLCRLLVPRYIAALPLDPLGGADLSGKEGCGTSDDPQYTTGYTVTQYLDGSIVVAAPQAEQNEKITLQIPSSLLKP